MFERISSFIAENSWPLANVGLSFRDVPGVKYYGRWNDEYFAGITLCLKGSRASTLQERYRLDYILCGARSRV